MLEYNFTKLDDDFITLWSRVVLTGDIGAEISALQELAEKGQINAVQSWYLVKAKGVNPTIDAIVESYDGNTYNELFAKHNYLCSDETTRNEYNELLDKVYDAYDNYCKNHHNTNYGAFSHARRDVYDHTIFTTVVEACNIANSQGKTAGNYLMLERYNEMYVAFMKIAPYVSRYEKDEIIFSIDKNNKIIVKSLSKQYKELKAQGKTVANNPQLAFALGKALCLFRNKKKHKEFGASLLKELAKRNYVYINPQSNFNV